MRGKREKQTGTGWFKVVRVITTNRGRNVNPRTLFPDGKKAQALQFLISMPRVLRIEIVRADRQGGEHKEIFYPPMEEATREELLEASLEDEPT